jgi:hypothetical protein
MICSELKSGLKNTLHQEVEQNSESCHDICSIYQHIWKDKGKNLYLSLRTTGKGIIEKNAQSA